MKSAKSERALEGSAVHRLVASALLARRAVATPAEHRLFPTRRVSATAALLDVDGYNRRFYERCWQAASLLPMPGVDPPAAGDGVQVEIGCGLRPRLPLSEGLFVDISPAACMKLHCAGARVIRASLGALPFASGAVSHLYVFDVLEHVDDDVAVARELARVSAAEGRLVLSTPLHAHRWQEFDRIVGHVRRYDPRALVDLLHRFGFRLEGFAHFGMRPLSPVLTRLAAYYLVHWPRTAFWFQEQFLRLAKRTAQPTQLRRAGVDAFLAEVADADGAVTAWRHQRPK